MDAITGTDNLAAAFPAALSEAVARVEACLPAPIHPNADLFEVIVEAERVHIPYRVYHPEPSTRSVVALDQLGRLILNCIYSRHFDGHVRQRASEQIVDSSEPWVVPFVMKLVGEYVIEIVEVIDERLGSLCEDDPRRASYARFARDNPLHPAHSSVGDSYWNCYYRGKYPNWAQHPNRSDYPTSRILGTVRGIA